MEEYPNVLIVPPNSETAEEIVEDYTEMIKYNLDRNVPLDEILMDFFLDVQNWSYKQFLLDKTRQYLQDIEDICNDIDFDE
ncbi:hypothetical protein LCM23_06240 [Cytobacillus kochii]|uniref:hypothetical protein n=1 Tax=Cytobacillus kochii TaxID=859143 RepID=UPI001CD2165A|nr:hypothetical protein [Cytobacillus kochii]MCA1025684.1 hypothetical protein [Cytobacillus kochii]